MCAHGGVHEGHTLPESALPIPRCNELAAPISKTRRKIEEGYSTTTRHLNGGVPGPVQAHGSPSRRKSDRRHELALVATLLCFGRQHH